MAKICKVLVVEDHEGIRHVLGDALKTEGYDFTLIDSAGDVQDALDNGGHDVAVIDLPLDRRDPFAMAATALANGIGLILPSRHQRPFPPIQGSGHCHIRKPFMLEQLLPLISRVLRELEIRCVRRRASEPAPRRVRRG